MLQEIGCVALVIGRDLYTELPLADGDLETFSVAGSSLPQCDICPRERLAFLTAMWPRIENALRRMETAPDTQLATMVRPSPVEQARHATPKALLLALARPIPQHRGGRRVLEEVPTPTVNTPANRQIKTLLTAFLKDVKVIADLAQVSNAPTVMQEALRLRNRLRQALRREPWRSLPVLDGTTRTPLPQPVWQNGPYRLLYDISRRYRRGFAFDWQHSLFHLPYRETWLLYEYWCFFQVAQSIRALGFRATNSDEFVLSRSGLTFSLVRGKASTLSFQQNTGPCLSLTYNRRFPEQAGMRGDGWHSRSHAMQPDVVLEGNGRLLVLDAKFKTYADGPNTGQDIENLPLTADINQCHAYRDGILHRGEPRVDAAYLLYPGQLGGTNRPLISYSGSPTSEVGALLLRSENDRERLCTFINDWLRTVIHRAQS